MLTWALPFAVHVADNDIKHYHRLDILLCVSHAFTSRCYMVSSPPVCSACTK